MGGRIDGWMGGRMDQVGVGVVSRILHHVISYSDNEANLHCDSMQ